MGTDLIHADGRMDGRDEDARNFLAILRQRLTTFAALRLTKLLWLLPATPRHLYALKGKFVGVIQ